MIFSAFTNAGYHFAAILVSPEVLGCTPSLRSIELIAVYWSTTQMGELVVLSPAAQAGIAAFRAVIWLVYEPTEHGIICATCGKSAEAHTTVER